MSSSGLGMGGGGEENYKCVSIEYDKDYFGIICKVYLYLWKYVDFNLSRYLFCGMILW